MYCVIGPIRYIAYNDVWSSLDGLHWEQMTDSAPWHPRIWFSSLAWRDRLWVIGGWSSEGAFLQTTVSCSH